MGTQPPMFAEAAEQAAAEQQHQEQLPPEPEATGPAASMLESAIDETVRRAQQSLQNEADKLEFQQRLAKMFAASGVFEGWEEKKQNLSPQQRIAQAMVKIQLGEACGMTPVEAMQSIYLVKGRPTLDAQIRAARMKRAGYDWVFVQLNDKGCTLIPCHKNQPVTTLKNGRQIRCFVDENGEPARVSFTEADARLAGLLPAKDDSSWKKYPVDLFFARAITRMQRRYASEVLNGAQVLDPSETDLMVLPEAERRPLFNVKQEEGVA